MHHIRTLRIMSEVYSKGLQKEVQLELQTVERLFPALDDLLELHTQHVLRLLERKRESQLEEGSSEGGFVINRIGDVLVSQVRGEIDSLHYDIITTFSLQSKIHLTTYVQFPLCVEP